MSIFDIRTRVRTAATSLAVVAALGVSSFTMGTAAAVDFSGERITIVVPFNEGGGTDSYTRFLQPYLEKYLPGNPKINVLNKSGAGGILGGNYFAQKAKPDGTWVLALSTSTITNYALGDKRVKFELKDFIPVILSPRGVMQYVRKDLGVQDQASLAAKVKQVATQPTDKLVFGGKTPKSMGLNMRVALSLLGIEVKSVWGMKGNGPMALAFERGEFTVNFDNTLSFKNNRKSMIEDGTAVPFYTFGVLNDEGKFVRDPAYPTAPTFVEAYKAIHGKDPEGPGYDAWKSLFQMSVTMSKSLNLPPNTPADVVEAWREAARKMMADAEFMAKRQKILGDYPQTIGDGAIPIRDQATKIPPEAKAWLAEYLQSRHNVKM